MSDVGDDNFMRYVYRDEEGERIPDGATHILVHESVTAIRAQAFYGHPNIVEVICHDNVEKIEEEAFSCCELLRRVIMPGVTIIEEEAFSVCYDLTDVECGKLEIVGQEAFAHCLSLRSINLQFARIVGRYAFTVCQALTDARFGNKLERIEEEAFQICTSLEGITIPLKDGIITNDNIFMVCGVLKHVDMVEA